MHFLKEQNIKTESSCQLLVLPFVVGNGVSDKRIL